MLDALTIIIKCQEIIRIEEGKMKNKKSFLCKLLLSMVAFFLAMSCFTFKVSAATKKNDKYEYTIKNGEVIIEKYIGNEEHINVPSKIDEYPVTKIKTYAFDELNVKTIYIPYTVTTLEEDIIFECKELTGLIIGSGVTEIEKGIGFSCPKLKYLVLGENVSVVNEDIFPFNSKEIVLSIPNENVEGTGYWSFSYNKYIYLDSNSPLYESFSHRYDYNDYKENVIVDENYVNIKFVQGSTTKAVANRIKEGTIVNDLYALNNTSKKSFVGWYTSPEYEERVDKIENADGEDIVLYAKFVDKPAAPQVTVKKINNTTYELKWDKKKDYFYQTEVCYAAYHGAPFFTMQEYKKNIGSYKAKVSDFLECMFRVKAYKLVDGIKVYSNYSKVAYHKKPVYPAVYVVSYELEMNSVGGVDNYIKYINNSDKKIKYIVFNVTPYNAVDDKIKCDIRNTSNLRLQDVGPLDKDCIGGGCWEAAWYNTTTNYSIITKAEIEYMDGTKKTINVNRISEWY